MNMFLGKTKYILTGLAFGFLLKLFVLDFLHVSGSSMQPSINSGSTVFFYKLSYGIIKPWGDKLLFRWKNPKVDDIVIFLHDNRSVIKRIVATEGTNYRILKDSSLEYSTDILYSMEINGKNIPLSQGQYNNLKGTDCVPEGTVLVIGDNYEDSIDSRDYGFVSINNILGKVICK